MWKAFIEYFFGFGPADQAEQDAEICEVTDSQLVMVDRTDLQRVLSIATLPRTAGGQVRKAYRAHAESVRNLQQVLEVLP
jgi:hypothetical protein